MAIPVPPRPSNTDLQGAVTVFVIAAALAFLAAATDAGGVGFLALAHGIVSGLWWADYWRKRDAWETWQQARQAERSAESDAD